MPQEVQNWTNALWRGFASADAANAKQANASITNAVVPMVKGRGR